jgi:hypothetical protein
MYYFTIKRSSKFELPLLVAGHGDVVHVLREVVGGSVRVRLVIESPILVRAVVPQLRVRNCDPILQRSIEVIPPRQGWKLRGKAAVRISVHTFG